jgi:hypothetical protein
MSIINDFAILRRYGFRKRYIWCQTARSLSVFRDCGITNTRTLASYIETSSEIMD